MKIEDTRYRGTTCCRPFLVIYEITTTSVPGTSLPSGYYGSRDHRIGSVGEQLGQHLVHSVENMVRQEWGSFDCYLRRWNTETGHVLQTFTDGAGYRIPMNAIGTVLIVVVLPQIIVTCKYDRHNWSIITCRIRSLPKYVIYRRYKVYHFETINCPAQ